MSFKPPDQIATAAVNAGLAKARLSPDRMFAGSILAGAYIGFAGLLGIAVTSGLKVESWGTLPSLIFGLVFSTGLILVIIAGSELRHRQHGAAAARGDGPRPRAARDAPR